MLHRAEVIRNYTLMSQDEGIGKVKDVYFDDRFWTVRYLMADTGGWLRGRQVLISPYAVVTVDEATETIATRLTTEQIENSPTPEADMPVSRQFEMAYHDYYGWPYYWYGPFAWAAFPQPMSIPEKVAQEQKDAWDGHMRSAQEVRGYGVSATDEDIGHVSDFIVDDTDWTIRYLVIDTRNWWPGKHVLLSPAWVETVDWPSRSVAVAHTREVIQQAPEYDEDTPLTREYEADLHRYYDRETYW